MKGSLHIVLFASLILMMDCAAGALHVKKLSAGDSLAEPDFVLGYGEVNAEGHIMTETAEYFAEQVKRLSGGKVLVEIYPSGQMGDDSRCYQAMKMGAMDLYRGNCSSLPSEQKTPMASVLALPYLFYDQKHFWEVCSSRLGQEMLADIQESASGMIGLTFFDEGARHFFTTETPIRRLSDIRGMKIRMQISDMMLDTAKALGAEPVPMEYVALYSALSVKTVDGAENPSISYYYNKFYEAAPYYLENAHSYAPGVLLVSQMTWENLGETYQNVLKEAAKRAMEYNREKIQEAEAEVRSAMVDAGVVITELEDPSDWHFAVRPVYEKYAHPFDAVIQKIKYRNYD